MLAVAKKRGRPKKQPGSAVVSRALAVLKSHANERAIAVADEIRRCTAGVIGKIWFGPANPNIVSRRSVGGWACSTSMFHKAAS